MAPKSKPQVQENEAVAEDAPEPMVITATEEEGALVIGEGSLVEHADAPRPWRVEVFGAEGDWGYRVVAANGTTVKEGTGFGDAETAAVQGVDSDEGKQASRVDKP